MILSLGTYMEGSEVRVCFAPGLVMAWIGTMKRDRMDMRDEKHSFEPVAFFFALASMERSMTSNEGCTGGAVPSAMCTRSAQRLLARRVEDSAPVAWQAFDGDDNDTHETDEGEGGGGAERPTAHVRPRFRIGRASAEGRLGVRGATLLAHIHILSHKPRSAPIHDADQSIKHRVAGKQLVVDCASTIFLRATRGEGRVPGDIARRWILAGAVGQTCYLRMWRASSYTAWYNHGRATRCTGTGHKPVRSLNLIRTQVRRSEAQAQIGCGCEQLGRARESGSKDGQAEAIKASQRGLGHPERTRGSHTVQGDETIERNDDPAVTGSACERIPKGSRTYPWNVVYCGPRFRK